MGILESLTLGFFLSTGSAAPADPATRQGRIIYSRVECRRDRELRVLEVEASAEERCRLVYTVGRKKKKIPVKMTHSFACRMERDKIRSELIAAKFDCDEPVDPYLPKEDS